MFLFFLKCWGFSPPALFCYNVYYIMNTHIIIDNGHGVDTKGKRVLMNNNQTFYEWEFNRNIKNRLLSFLQDSGITYTDLVQEAHDISLFERVDRANEAYQKNIEKNPFLISIHSDAFYNKEANGITVFSSKGITQSDKIASVFVDELSNLNFNNRYDVDREGNKGREANYYILKKTKCPAVLIEIGFYTNDNDLKRINDSEYQYNIARYLFNAIYKLSDSGIGGS